jgi:hypothetical protein
MHENSRTPRIRIDEDRVDMFLSSGAATSRTENTYSRSSSSLSEASHRDRAVSPGTAPSRSGNQRAAAKDSSPLAMDAIFHLWRVQHPDATLTEVNAEMRRRMLELRDRERVRSLAMMRQYYEEIATLEKEASGQSQPSQRGGEDDAESGPRSIESSPALDHLHVHISNVGLLSSADSSPASAAAPGKKGHFAPRPPAQQSAPPARRCTLPPSDPSELEKQRLAWDLLVNSRGGSADTALAEASMHFGAMPSSINAGEQQTSIFVTVALGGSGAMGGANHPGARDESFAGYGDVGSWVQKHWRHATHRHEAAATRAQCAFRRFMAKKEADRRRLQRKAAIEAVMASEASYEDTWMLAVAAREENSRAAVAAEKRVRVLRGFLRRVKAWMDRRRRANKLQSRLRAETQNYAATKIQALVRGHLDRLRVHLLRHPEIAVHREWQLRSRAAACIQALVRSSLTRIRNKKRAAAALRAQTMYRRHLAVVRVTALRRAKRAVELAAVAAFSARVLQRFFGRLVALKYRRYRRFAPQVLALQAAGRGFRCRRTAVATLLHERRTAAAITIQTTARRCLARGIVAKQREEIAARVVADQRNHAAAVIARAFRRATRQQQLRIQAHRDDAAREIQRLVRGHLGRRRAKTRRASLQHTTDEAIVGDAAVTIQSLVRGFLTRRALHPPSATESPSPAPDGAAAVLQRFYRRHIRGPSLAATLHRAARVVACFFRCVPAMRRVQQLRQTISDYLSRSQVGHAALIIQLWTRVRLAKERTLRLRVDRNAAAHALQQREASEVLVRFFRGAVARSRLRTRRVARFALEIAAAQDKDTPTAESLPQSETSVREEPAELQEGEL